MTQSEDSTGLYIYPLYQLAPRWFPIPREQQSFADAQLAHALNCVCARGGRPCNNCLPGARGNCTNKVSLSIMIVIAAFKNNTNVHRRPPYWYHNRDIRNVLHPPVRVKNLAKKQQIKKICFQWRKLWCADRAHLSTGTWKLKYKNQLCIIQTVSIPEVSSISSNQETTSRWNNQRWREFGLIHLCNPQ